LIDYIPLIAREILCSPLKIHVAIIGSPIGLIRKAKPKRIRPLLTEQVSITVTARMLRIVPAKANTNAEQESSPTQIQVNKSITSAKGNIKILNTVLIETPPYPYHTRARKTHQ